jgi:hypothetical protein
MHNNSRQSRTKYRMDNKVTMFVSSLQKQCFE